MYLFIIALKRITVGFIIHKIKLNNLATAIGNFDELSEYSVHFDIVKTHDLNQYKFWLTRVICCTCTPKYDYELTCRSNLTESYRNHRQLNKKSYSHTTLNWIYVRARNFTFCCARNFAFRSYLLWWVTFSETQVLYTSFHID